MQQNQGACQYFSGDAVHLTATAHQKSIFINREVWLFAELYVLYLTGFLYTGNNLFVLANPRLHGLGGHHFRITIIFFPRIL